MAGDDQVCRRPLGLLEFAQVAVVDVHRQDRVNAVLIIRAIDWRATIGSGRHLDDPAADRILSLAQPQLRLDQRGFHLGDRPELADEPADRRVLTINDAVDEVDEILPADDVRGQVEVHERQFELSGRVNDTVVVGRVQGMGHRLPARKHRRMRDITGNSDGAHLCFVPLDDGRNAQSGSRADRVMGNDAVGTHAASQQELANVDIDRDKHSVDVAVDVDLGIRRRLGATGEAVCHRHDLAQPHVGIIAILSGWAKQTGRSNYNPTVPGTSSADQRGEGGFAPTFKEAVGRWRRRHRHPPPQETWFAVHYRVGWLVERLSYLESIHLLRQGLDVRSLAAERPARRKKGEPEATHGRDNEGIDVEDEPSDAIVRNDTRASAGDAG